jgi:hypothetical protein
VGREAKETGMERRLGGGEGMGGRTLPPRSNAREETMKRRMKIEMRGK